MALLHLVDVSAMLDDIEPLRTLRSGEGPGPARDAFATAVGRWIEADPAHPVVVLVADGPTRSPPVAGLITKRSGAIEKELLKRLGHGWRRYRVVSHLENVCEAAKAMECELLEPAALWDELAAALGADPLAPAAAEPAAEPSPPPPAKKKAAKKKAKKKASAKKKAPAKKKEPSDSAPPSKAPEPDPEPDPAASLDALVNRALQANPPQTKSALPPAPPKPALPTEGNLSGDDVEGWLDYFKGDS